MAYDYAFLENKAIEVRELLIKVLVNAGSGHSGGPLGSADFFSAIFFTDVFNLGLLKVNDEDRDRFVLSAGHYAPLLYTVLGEVGYFSKEELWDLRKLGSRLQGHPHFEVVGNKNLPGIEITSGPLGQGISQAVGMAMAAKLDNSRKKIICFMSDGEQNEGQVWEAYMSINKYKLTNLISVIDRNFIQIDGHTESVMPLEPLRDKLLAFGFEVMDIDGHDYQEILFALGKAKSSVEKPTAIILRTIPGKGVSFMENDFRWHGKPPVGEGEAVKALADLRKIRSLNGALVTELD